MSDLRDNRELMKSRPREVCRACGSVSVHTQNYDSPQPECLRYLRRKLADAEREIHKLGKTLTPAASPWISVDTLPSCALCSHAHGDHFDNGTRQYCCDGCSDYKSPQVLICAKGGFTHLGAFSHHHHLHFAGDKYDFELGEIDAWMPIPPYVPVERDQMGQTDLAGVCECSHTPDRHSGLADLPGYCLNDDCPCVEYKPRETK